MKKPHAQPRLRNRAAAAALPPGLPRAGSLTRQRKAYSRFREQYDPLQGLTLSHALSLLREEPRGVLADLQWTYLHIERADADLLALIELGLSRLAEMDWDIAISKEAEPTLAAAQADYLRQRFDKIDNVEEAIEHLALARFRGYAHCEQITDGRGQLIHLEVIDQWNVVRDGLRGGWRYNPEARATPYSGLPADHDLPLERLLWREVARPLNRLALLKYVRAGLCEKNWDSWAEIYGLPSGVVVGPPNVPTDREDEFAASAALIAEGGNGYLPHGSLYVQNKADAAAMPFRGRLDYLTEKLVLAGTGGKLTMLTAATGLGSGASEAHSQVFDTIAAAEAGRISRVLQRQLCDRWLAERFPGQPPAAYFKLAPEKEADPAAQIEAVIKLAQAGYQLDSAEVQERTGWKIVGWAAPAPAAAPVPTPLFNQDRLLNRAQGEAAALSLATFDDYFARALALPGEAERRAALAALAESLPTALTVVPEGDPALRLLEAGMAEALVAGVGEATPKDRR